MTRDLLVLAALVLCVQAVNAQENCRTESVATAAGAVDHVICRDSSKRRTHTIRFNDQNVLRSDFLVELDNNKNRSLWVYAGAPLDGIGCPDRLYLVDLSMKPVKVTAFGVKKACNEFHWASWGEKRSVIALKNNVRFTYENGKMTSPEGGEKLWKSIEPPHAGAGLPLEDAVPFVEDVPLPK